MVNGQKTMISLQIPTELEAAVNSLAATSFAVSFEVGGGSFARICLNTVNDVLLYLIQRGIKDTLVSVDNQIEQTEGKLGELSKLQASIGHHPTHTTCAELADIHAGNPAATPSTEAKRGGLKLTVEQRTAANDLNEDVLSQKDALGRLKNARVALHLAHTPYHLP